MEERWTKVRSQIALEKKRNPNADVTELRRSLKAAHLAEYIDKVVSEAPPLTSTQRDKLALLLRGGGHGTAA